MSRSIIQNYELRIKKTLRFFSVYVGVGLLLCLVLAGCQRGRTYFPAAKEMAPQHVEIVRFDSALLVDGQTEEGIQRLFAT